MIDYKNLALMVALQLVAIAVLVQRMQSQASHVTQVADGVARYMLTTPQKSKCGCSKHIAHHSAHQATDPLLSNTTESAVHGIKGYQCQWHTRSRATDNVAHCHWRCCCIHVDAGG